MISDVRPGTVHALLAALQPVMMMILISTMMTMTMTIVNKVETYDISGTAHALLAALQSVRVKMATKQCSVKGFSLNFSLLTHLTTCAGGQRAEEGSMTHKALTDGW